MAVGYPASFDTVLQLAATLSGPPQHTTVTTQHAELLAAIMAELGLNPSGADATVAATLAALSSRYESLATRHAQGWLGAGSAGALTSVGTTPLTLITTSNFAIAANRRTRWSFMCSGYGNTLGDQFAIKVYSAGGGTLICTENIEVTGAGRYMMPPLSMSGFDTPAASGSTTYLVTITRTTGTGTFTIANTASFNNHLTVEDVGPNP